MFACTAWATWTPTDRYSAKQDNQTYLTESVNRLAVGMARSLPLLRRLVVVLLQTHAHMPAFPAIMRTPSTRLVFRSPSDENQDLIDQGVAAGEFIKVLPHDDRPTRMSPTPVCLQHVAESRAANHSPTCLRLSPDSIGYNLGPIAQVKPPESVSSRSDAPSGFALLFVLPSHLCCSL